MRVRKMDAPYKLNEYVHYVHRGEPVYAYCQAWCLNPMSGRRLAGVLDDRSPQCVGGRPVFLVRRRSKKIVVFTFHPGDLVWWG